MKKILNIFLTFAFVASAFAQFNDLGVTVSHHGTLMNTSASVFRAKNYIASKSDIPILKTLVLGMGLNGIRATSTSIISSMFSIGQLLNLRLHADTPMSVFIPTPCNDTQTKFIGLARRFQKTFFYAD